ncbi:MAG: hypothetical protein QOE31_3135, partial [Solirubrobacteraceae bacterium]|nr:hypothetical protein [Solirubrobacteraceae bacterium]
LAADVVWPPTPDLAERVVARIAADVAAEVGAGAGAGARTPARLRRPPRWSPLVLGHGPALAIAAILTLLVAGALVPPVRSAVLDVLGIAGRERVIRVPAAPDTSRPALDQGAPTTLALARRSVAFEIRLPRVLGAPREVRVSDAIAGRAVTLVYPDATLLEFAGGLDPVLQKRIGPGADARPVTVAGGLPGFFITGVRELDVLDREGHPVRARGSLARADTLVWQVRGVAYRLEARGGLRRALAIARSVDPA